MSNKEEEVVQMNRKVNTPSRNRHSDSHYIYFLRLFTISSVVAAIVILSLVSAGIYRIYNNYIIRDAEADARNLGFMLFNQERDVLFSQDSAGRTHVFVPEKDFPDLDRRMRRYLEPLQILKIKIFSKDKKIVYSTDHTIIGKIDSDNERLGRSLAGETISKIETEDMIWDLANEERFDVDLIETYTPIKAKNNDIIGSFEVYADVTRYRKEITGAMTASVAITSVVLVCVFGFLFVLMKRATKVIEHLAKKEKEAAAAKAVAEVEHEKATELERAYEELKEAQDTLIQVEKLNAVGQLASGVAHEVRNPLGIILQGTNYLEKKLSPKEEDSFRTLGIIKNSVKRADRIISSLLDFSRATSLDLQPGDINSILEDSLSLAKVNSGFKNVDIVRETKADLPKVLVDKIRMEQVFINMFLNAIHAMPKGGKLVIRSYDKELGQAKNGVGKRRDGSFVQGERAVIVEIEDTGIGISERNLRRIFDPFFTTKGPRGGTGLGLSVSRNIINLHGGLIDIRSQTGKGTTVVITLKIARG